MSAFLTVFFFYTRASLRTLLIKIPFIVAPPFLYKPLNQINWFRVWFLWLRFLLLMTYSVKSKWESFLRVDLFIFYMRQEWCTGQVLHAGHYAGNHKQVETKNFDFLTTRRHCDEFIHHTIANCSLIQLPLTIWEPLPCWKGPPSCFSIPASPWQEMPW